MTPEAAGCPICGGAGDHLYLQRDLFCGVPGEFGQRHCGPCDVYFQSPRVPENQIGPYYPSSYLPYKANAHQGLMFRVASMLGLPQRRRRIVERFIQRGKILDAGCGSGDFLWSLGEGGDAWERYGMDIQRPEGPDAPPNFFAGRFDLEKPPWSGLDVITLWHVFEHFYHPQRALDHAGEMLRDGGYLFIAVPNPNSVDRYMFGKDWAGWDPPRHVATYTPASAKTMLAKSGFQLIGVVPDVPLGEFLSTSTEFYLRAKGFVSRIPNWLWLRVLLCPFSYGSGLIGRPGAQVFVARKGGSQ